MKQDELLSRLERLLPAQFEGMLFHLRIPSAQLAGVSAPQSTRAIELLRHLENTGELARLEPLLLSYEGAADVSRISAQPQAAAKPVPVYPNAEVEVLSKRLENARARKKRLCDSGLSTDDVDRDILELRRQLREGGQLRAGDALSDGRYLLLRVVGRGGFAVVWEAFDTAAQQRVAIKVLHSSLASDSLRQERFFRGARAMMNLAHPAVVRVLEPSREDGGFYYFVMEFVPGGNLREAVLAQRVKRADLLTVIHQVGDALASAHAVGMVHRDVKPSNIMLDENGAAKLTDFDLVGAYDTTGGTRTGALGTVVYAAPECLEKPQEATACADVFGLGMTAIFCLAGRDLSMDTFRDPEDTIHKLACSIQVKAVLRRAVAWAPLERFADAAAMMLELRNTGPYDLGAEAHVSSAVPARAALPLAVPAQDSTGDPTGAVQADAEYGPTLSRDFLRDPLTELASPAIKTPLPAALAAKIHAPVASEIRRRRPSRRTPSVLQAIFASKVSEPMPEPRLAPAAPPPAMPLTATSADATKPDMTTMPAVVPGLRTAGYGMPRPASLTGQIRWSEVDEIPSQYKLGAARRRWFTYIVSGLIAVSVAAGVTFLIIRITREATPTTGSVHVVSVPTGADVSFDGTLLADRTPVTIDGAPVGTPHKIVVSMRHYQEYTEVVTIPKTGVPVQVMAELTTQTGKIVINTTPSGATIVINGSVRGTTPNSLSGIDIDATSQIELVHTDFGKQLVPLKWDASGTAYVDYKFSP